MKAKTIVGVIGALLPVLYCAGLLYYFVDETGSIGNAQEIGLGPTLLGLGLIGLIFYIPLVLRLFRMMGAPRSPKSGGHGSATVGGGGSGPVTKAAAPARAAKADADEVLDDMSGADAAIARYMARRSAEAAAGTGTPPPGDGASTSFGRRSR